MTPGCNPMRWDCSKSGCFNLKRRPKIEVFAECFPRRINFGDIDGIVELSNLYCLLEWKGHGGTLQMAQSIMYRQFTRVIGNVVYVVNGDAESMEIESYFKFWCGEPGTLRYSDLDELKSDIGRWAQWAAKLAT